MKQNLSQIGCFLLAAGLVFGAAEIEVQPLAYDFGLVQAGSSESTLITVSNPGDEPLVLEAVSFEAGSSEAFQITSLVFPPVVMSAGAQFTIEVTFTPVTGGPASATLTLLSTDPDEPVTQIVFTGQAPAEEQTPQEQIAAIIAFVEESKQDGSLQGSGPGRSAANRLNALQNMLDEAGDLIESGLYDPAVRQLESIYQKIEGSDKANVFVKGPAAAELAQWTLDLMQTVQAML